jgi:hypothetical protein
VDLASVIGGSTVGGGRGGSCIRRANVLCERGAIASKKYSNSLSTSFSLFSCVITLGNLAVNLKFLGVLLTQLLTIKTLGIL